MEITSSLFLIASALLFGAISPGPSFVLVARISMGNGRRDGVASAVGMGVGGVAFSILALLGLQAALLAVPVVYTALKIVGGLYLVYLATRIWRGAKGELAMGASSPDATKLLKRPFFLGLMTQISNPKTAVVYGSILAALLPPDFPVSVYIALPVVVFLVESGWYTIVALAMSSASPRAGYLKFKTLIDRITGGIMAALGLRLATSVVSR